jgi:polysaccharide export outer membrane protein
MRKLFAKIFLLSILILFAFTSCNRRAQLLYFNNISNESLKTLKIPEYALRAGDVLYIQIITQDPIVANLFNNKGLGNAIQASLFTNESSNYLYGYSVSDSGFVQLPVLGKLKIIDLTINQCRELIQKQAEKYLNDGIAVVKLLSFKVTILGEVKIPGVKINLKDNLTIFEGLGLAGDVTDYADRRNVMLIRQTPEGVKTLRINLQDKSLLFSEAYYLAPNDMIVVEPRKGKLFTMNSPNISIYLSIVSTTLLLISYILK